MKQRTSKAKEQSKLFVEKAREIGCEDAADEDEIMRRLANQERQKKPPPRQTKTPPKRG